MSPRKLDRGDNEAVLTHLVRWRLSVDPRFVLSALYPSTGLHTWIIPWDLSRCEIAELIHRPHDARSIACAPPLFNSSRRTNAGGW